MTLRFVDWFAGVGGIRLGLERAGFSCVWSCEIEDFQRRVYRERFGHEHEAKDIREVRPEASRTPISGPAGSPARISRRPGVGPGSTGGGAPVSSGRSSRSPRSDAPSGSSSRTCEGYSPEPMALWDSKTRTWSKPQMTLFRGPEPFSGPWLSSVTWDLSACWMRSASEFPRGGGVSSSLLEILEKEEDIPESCWLSRKACRGILERAERRGRTLPEPLRTALGWVAENGPN